MQNSFDLRELVENAKNMQNIVDDESTIEDSEAIKKQVNQILQYCLNRTNCVLRQNELNNYKQKCMQEFPDFHGRYPTLFFAIIENPTTFPLYRLNEMFKIKKNIEENKIDKDTASAALGQKYYNEFVKDTVAELDKKL
jgi:hypothetical protein